MVKEYNFKRITTVIMALIIAVALLPNSIAHAAVNNVYGIPIKDNYLDVPTWKTASVTINEASFEISDVKENCIIDVDDETFHWEGDRNIYMDDEYELVISYHPYIGGIKPGYVDPNKIYTGTLRVPVPTGYDGSSAVRIEASDKDPNEADRSKVKVAAYSDGTISFPVTLEYWEHTVDEMNYVGEFRCRASIEFKHESKKPNPAVKVPGKGVVSKISNVKGAKAKITVKKVSGATAYQIRYKVGNDKEWKTASNKTGTFKVKVAKGKKITVQARVSNKGGYGKWGSSKKFKTDKK